MDMDNADIGNRISKATDIFRKLSNLFFIVFVIIVIWALIVCSLLVISIKDSSADSSLFLSASPMLSVYILYSINFSLVPLLLSKMLKDISVTRRPFTKENSRRLFAMAVIMVLYAILERLSLEIQSQFLLFVGNHEIQVGSFIYDFASHSGTSLNVFPLVIAAVFFALSYVFKYGVLLQQESDETL